MCPFALSLSKGFDKLSPNGLGWQAPIILSLSKDKLSPGCHRLQGHMCPFALSLSKGFDKLSPNGLGWQVLIIPSLSKDKLSPFDKLRTRGGFDKLSPNGEWGGKH